MKRIENPRKSLQNRNKFNINKNYNTIIQENNYEDDNDENENSDEDDDDDYEGKKKKKVKIIKIKKAKSKARTKKVSVKFNTIDDSSDEEKNKKNEPEEEVVHDRTEVENAIRNRLFRNKSATKRKKNLKK